MSPTREQSTEIHARSMFSGERTERVVPENFEATLPRTRKSRIHLERVLSVSWNLEFMPKRSLRIYNATSFEKRLYCENSLV